MSGSGRHTKKPWHRHFETVGSISAIVVGLAALYVSWDQGRVMREEVRASVWPALQVDRIFRNEENRLVIALQVQNAGVGPAMTRGITVRYRGEVIASSQEFAARLPEYDSMAYQGIRGRVIAAGDTLSALEIGYNKTDDIDVQGLLAEVDNAWTIEVCYCSTLGECWVSDEASSAPRSTAECTDGLVSDF